jgi:hypothetical protein
MGVGFIVVDEFFRGRIPAEWPSELHRQIVDVADGGGAVADFGCCVRLLA